MTGKTPIADQSAVSLRDRLATGALSAVDLTKAAVARIEAREPEVQAWAWFDAEAALREAERLDALRASGAPQGPLHGLPVGVKDVIDTAGIPTENGCPVDEGRIPAKDAAVVARLKAAGAIMFGKTVTTELAFLYPNKTRNPMAPGFTPGGSSSGSAAAVADGMIPLAIGTQTGGSVVRPASFCGITGFKPSFNAISRDGVLLQSPSLDTLGVFASDPEGAALLADALFGTPSGLLDAAQRGRASVPVLGVVEPPGWSDADTSLHVGFERLRASLAGVITDMVLPEIFDDVVRHRAAINTAEMGSHYRRYLEDGADRLGPPTRAAIEEGLAMPAQTYLAAKACQDALSPALDPIFRRCDAILCPAAPGPAPEGLSSTGDSIFNGLWTMAGTPTITLPLLSAPDGRPMGVQLVGPVGADAALLATARWLWDHMREAGDGGSVPRKAVPPAGKAGA
ncbi:MAG: amidase [Pseudomonadota bacterium]